MLCCWRTSSAWPHPRQAHYTIQPAKIFRYQDKDFACRYRLAWSLTVPLCTCRPLQRLWQGDCAQPTRQWQLSPAQQGSGEAPMTRLSMTLESRCCHLYIPICPVQCSVTSLGSAALFAVAILQELKGSKRGRGVLDPLKENMVAATPAAAAPSMRGVPFTPAAPATLMRIPKLGEVFYSQKGSILFSSQLDTHSACLLPRRTHPNPRKTPTDCMHCQFCGQLCRYCVEEQ